jgi:hypothetical protein
VPPPEKHQTASALHLSHFQLDQNSHHDVDVQPFFA